MTQLSQHRCLAIGGTVAAVALTLVWLGPYAVSPARAGYGWLTALSAKFDAMVLWLHDASRQLAGPYADQVSISMMIVSLAAVGVILCQMVQRVRREDRHWPASPWRRRLTVITWCAAALLFWAAFVVGTVEFHNDGPFWPMTLFLVLVPTLVAYLLTGFIVFMWEIS